MEKKVAQKGVWQYHKMIWKRAWPKLWEKVGVLSIILGLIALVIIASISIYSQNPKSFKDLVWSGVVDPALLTAVVWAILLLVMMFYYAAKETVLEYNIQQTDIEAFKEKYEGGPVEIHLDLTEWEHDEPVVITNSGPITLYPRGQMIISVAGIRVKNTESIELTEVYGSLVSLTVLTYDGHHKDLFQEATRNGSLFSWSGGSEGGYVRIESGQDRILKIGEGRNRDLFFILQDLEYQQTDNGNYNFEIEFGGKIFDKPIKRQRRAYQIQFEKLDKIFLGGPERPYGSTDANSTSVVNGFTEYVSGSFRKLRIVRRD